MKRLFLYALLTGLCGAGNVQAQLFSQLPQDGGVSFGATLDDQITDDFMLSTSASIGSIRWWGGEGLPTTPVADMFSIRFYTGDSTGTPEISPFTTMTISNPARNATGLNAFPGQPIFEYESALPQAVSIAAGETYYLSIAALSPNWGWASSNASGSSWIRSSDNDSWVPRLNPSGDLAFELNAVPIPPAFILFLTPMIALFVTGRLRNRPR